MATKLSFIYEGVSYKDIDAKLNSSSSRDYYRVNEVGTAQMIRQWIKKNYPAVPLRGFYTVKSNSFANGNSVDVTLTNPPLEVRNSIYKYLTDNFEYYQQHLGFGQYKQKKSVVYPKTADGKDIEFGAKFISVDASNVDPNDTATQELWLKSAGAKKQLSIKKGTGTSPNNEAKKQGYPIGQIIMECAGWDIGKKTLPDGRVVYNARIKANTQPNKTDWTTIKNEIYINTGFKWGKFNAFEKWGQISNESFTINKLCEILNKYYKDESPAAPQPTPQTPTQSPSVPTPTPNQPTKQEILLAIESMKLLAKYGNKDAEQAIKTFETLLKYQP